MRKLAVSVGVILSVVFLSSCEQRTPEEMAKKYCIHLCKGEYDKIQDCALENRQAFWGWCNKTLSVEDKRKKAKEKVEVLNVQCKIIGAEAICSCLVKVGDEIPQSEFVKLKKVGNAWFVDQGEEILIPTTEEMQFMKMDDDEAYNFNSVDEEEEFDF
jgi:hypothetical protein